MGNRFPVIALILLGAFVLSPPRSAESGQFKISPVRLYLGADRTSDVLRVSNRGVEPLLLHLNVQAWDHPAGRDRFQDTRDVLLNPMIFELAPGQERLVRIGLMRPSGVEREQAYRLFIREVPQLARKKRRQIDTVLHVSMPVFVAPEESSGPELVWRLERTGATALALWVENRGEQHAEVTSITLLGSSAEQPLAIDRRIYVLSGQTRRLEVPRNLADQDGPLTLTAETRNGPLQEALYLGKRSTAAGERR